MPVLKYEMNPFGGAVIDPDTLPEKADVFSASLQETIEFSKNEKIKALWLRLPINLSTLIPAAVSAGFTYHHADEGHLQMTRRISPDAFIPPYATHYIGAGGVVLDQDRRLLVITERYHSKRHYKLPGGALDPGEHIADAAKREVLEETGIRTEFLSLVCFRHWHGYRFGKSDIYFVCRLKPVSFDITPDPREIAEALWMPVDDYLTHPDTHPFNRKIVRAALDREGLFPGDIEGYGTPETHEMFF